MSILPISASQREHHPRPRRDLHAPSVRTARGVLLVVDSLKMQVHSAAWNGVVSMVTGEGKERKTYGVHRDGPLNVADVARVAIKEGQSRDTASLGRDAQLGEALVLLRGHQIDVLVVGQTETD